MPTKKAAKKKPAKEPRTKKAAPKKAAPKKAAPKKAAPKGAAKRRTMNVPEAQRHTDRVMLRLDPEVAGRLRAIAAAWHVTLAEVVTDALDALRWRTPGRKR